MLCLVSPAVLHVRLPRCRCHLWILLDSWFWLSNDIVHPIGPSWTFLSRRWYMRTHEDILDSEAVQHHKSKTSRRMLGGAGRIYGTHHVNYFPYDSQSITEMNCYIWALWRSPVITDKMLNSYLCCLTWRTHGLSQKILRLNWERERHVILLKSGHGLFHLSSFGLL